MTAPSERHALRQLRVALIQVDPRFSTADLHSETSLVDDLGLDSIRFVDLTAALEEAFGISEFPMQDWYDSEAARRSNRFTAGSLAALCAELAKAQSEASLR